VNAQQNRTICIITMYKLCNTDEETAIAELKSDIVKANLKLEKIKSLTRKGRPDSRLRAGKIGATRDPAEMEEVINSLTSQNVEESKYKLQQMLREKMMEVETLVYEMISDPGDPIPSPSMSRLPVWIKLLDRHLWTYSPELVLNSPREATTGRPVALKSEQIAPMQNLLWHHSVKCNAQPGAPEWLAVAADALGAKIGELYKKIEGQRMELTTMKENSKFDQEGETCVADITNELIAANKNVVLLTKRVCELEEITSDVQKTWRKEKADHEDDVQFSRKSQ
jgi:hypothetical protein